MERVELVKGLLGRWKTFSAEYLRAIDLEYIQVRLVDTGAVEVIKLSQFIITPNQEHYKARALDLEWLDEDKNLNRKWKEIARERYSVLTEIWSLDKPRQDRITEVEQKLGIKQAQIYRLLAKLKVSNNPHSVMFKKRGPKPGLTRLSDDVESIIKHVINIKIKEREKFSYADIYLHVSALCVDSSLPVPCVRTVTDRIKNKITDKQLMRLRKGSDAMHDKYDPKPGSLEVSEPLEVVQIDHTLVDIILVDEDHRLPIGRPWVTVAIDLYTRVIIGFELSLRAPSRLSVANCVSNACLIKDDWLQSIEVEDLSYPFYGTPKQINVDNAAEFHSDAFQSACEINNIKVAWRKRKHWGGHVERVIGTMMTSKIHFLPGTTRSNPQERKGYDSEQKSIYTFKEFREVFIRELAIYHSQKHRSLNLSPKRMWLNYYQSKGGEIRLPPVVCDPRTIKIDFLPDKFAVVHNYGIVFSCLRYWCPALATLIGKRVKIKYNPESLAKIWVRDDVRYIDVSLQDLRHPDVSLDELKKAKKILAERGSDFSDHEMFDQIKLLRKCTIDASEKTKKARRDNEKLKLISESSKLESLQVKKSEKIDQLPGDIRYKNKPAALDWEYE